MKMRVVCEEDMDASTDVGKVLHWFRPVRIRNGQHLEKAVPMPNRKWRHPQANKNKKLLVTSALLVVTRSY